MQSVDKRGCTVVWDIDTNSVSGMTRNNIRREDFNVGETVKMFGAPSRYSTNRLLATNMLRENGGKLALFGKPAGLNAAITGGGGVANPAATIFHVWVNEFGLEGFVPSWKKDYPLTKAAQKTLNSWNAVTDTVTHGCQPKGMPTIMEQPYPMDFVDKGDVS